MNESDPRSDVHYLGRSENKAWKKFIKKHYTINIADPSSMQDACHINELHNGPCLPWSLCSYVVEHRSTESKEQADVDLLYYP